jgi:radical SAM superfamily enzyme YgiQ (UPF0313 family)
MYKGKRFRVRPLDALRADIVEAGECWPRTRRVFLADGDALALSTDALVQILDLLGAAFPELSRVGVYVNAANVDSKTDAELRLLSERKLRIGYLGLESGHASVLKEMCKGAGVDEMVTAVRRCQANGIKMSVMALLGLGGTARSREHARDTAGALSRMNPRYLSFLSVMPVPGTPLQRWIETGRFQELAPSEMLQEMRWIIEDLELQGTIFRSNHASNYAALSGRFPQDKARLLNELAGYLDGSSKMRQEWQRGL